MWRRIITRRKLKIAGVLAVLLVVAINAVAFLHARAMTHFVALGERTPPPEQMTTGQKLRVLFAGVRVPRPENRQTPREVGLDFETVNFAGAGGIQLEAWHTRPPAPRGIVLLFHGYSASKESLLAAAQVFHELGCETLLVDFYGSGGSGGNGTSIGYHEAADVAAAYAWAQKRPGRPPIFLYGASMGAAAILRAVHVQGIEPAALILECPFDRLLTTTRNRFTAMHLPSFPFAQLLVFWGGVQEGFNGFKHNPAVYARSAHCPTLLLSGERDPRVTVEQIRNIFDQLSGARSLAIIRNLGHGSAVSPQHTKGRQSVRTFLDALPKATVNKLD
jgi:alpha-beta hydrolase superfamily lysophospholipase